MSQDQLDKAKQAILRVGNEHGLRAVTEIMVELEKRGVIAVTTPEVAKWWVSRIPDDMLAQAIVELPDGRGPAVVLQAFSMEPELFTLLQNAANELQDQEDYERAMAAEAARRARTCSITNCGRPVGHVGTHGQSCSSMHPEVRGASCQLQGGHGGAHAWGVESWA